MVNIGVEKPSRIKTGFYIWQISNPPKLFMRNLATYIIIYLVLFLVLLGKMLWEQIGIPGIPLIIIKAF